ncbi:RNA polymerase factor sigma-54 [Erythrobacter crassostreae]|uniref:RNA polymerase sigma-54 factor n=1 Tax=Erythrobacter crassostreae TaxID=2828328 RepID=A0A9X1F1E8_9SPHN|nr:RNA polymerase factor sigma-54 [Erythrobacter crassostrea]MBV7258359.1 RNA polymerase factor sigma-54 [Erythrobacter crassostrea]
MALGPRLDLRQSQQLVMTPQLQQAIKLLAASNLEIETFIGDALESNPLLEAGSVTSEDSGASEPDDIPREEFTSDQLMAQGSGESEAPLDIDTGALDRDRDTGDGSSAASASNDAEWGSAASEGAVSGEDFPDINATRAAETTLTEHLNEQVGAIAVNAKEAFIARHLIGLLDDAGYLSGDLREIGYDLGVTRDEVDDGLTVLQMLDPTGVGARGLAECLELQAREADRFDPCMEKLIGNLELVARGEVEKLKRLCGVDDEDFADMLGELRSFDPKPGLAFAPATDNAVVPDVLLAAKDDGGWDIKLNEATLPRLVVNRDYYVELNQGSPGAEAQSWLKEKLADAHWLIRALDQRQKTILKTAAEIVKQQDGFFRRGVSELRPLTLREVAEQIDMHESTVSRVTSNKYLHCDRGCFELKYFFTSGVGSSDGEGASSEAIKARIKALTDGEDPKKVLSDQKLVDLLKEEGFDLARRTVAKYREAVGIGSSAQRRRIKKLSGI